MRQPAARVLAGAIAWLILSAAALFIFKAEREIDAARSTLRVFDLQARETTDALGELRSAQQAYVVGGQGVAFWVAKVVTTGDVVRANIGMMRQAATSVQTRAALDDAERALRQFGDADKRALEYINSSQPLMAGDVVFTEGGQAAASVTQHVEAARVAERQDIESREGSTRRYEAFLAVLAAVVSAAVVLLLVPAMRIEHPADASAAAPAPAAPVDTWQPSHTRGDERDPIEYARRIRLLSSSEGAAGTPPLADEPVVLGAPEPMDAAGPDDAMSIRLGLDEVPVEVPRTAPRARNEANRLTLDTTDLAPVPAPQPAASGFLKAAADLATDFGRAQEMKDLTPLIARVATLTDASGVVVWLGNAQGGDLRPLLTYGYSPQVVNRLTPVPRSASNAAAAAYRTGTLQVVPSQPFSSGAIVAPILGPDGCIGALSAEFRGAEASESVQAFAAIIAAHLAGVFGAAAAGEAGESRLAVG